MNLIDTTNTFETASKWLSVAVLDAVKGKLAETFLNMTILALMQRLGAMLWHVLNGPDLAAEAALFSKRVNVSLNIVTRDQRGQPKGLELRTIHEDNLSSFVPSRNDDGSAEQQFESFLEDSSDCHPDFDNPYAPVCMSCHVMSCHACHVVWITVMHVGG